MTKKEFKPKRILWVDLEMTGLDPVEDRIVEVAAIVTDWNFKQLATFEATIHVDKELMDQRMVGEFWESYPDVRQTLMEQSQAGQPSGEVEQKLLRFIDEQIGEDKVLLAGNSIHQDRRFIDNEWPKLSQRLHYRMLDVSAWKVVFEGKYGKKFAKPETHRALEDIRGSIMELEYYTKKIRKNG